MPKTRIRLTWEIVDRIPAPGINWGRLWLRNEWGANFEVRWVRGKSVSYLEFDDPKRATEFVLRYA